MRFSIVVPTYDRPIAVRECLDSITTALSNASPLEAEILLVNNNPAITTSDDLKNWAKNCVFQVRLLNESKAGVSHARNRALMEGKGDIFVFVDDDCRIKPDYFKVLERYYAKDTEPVMRGGRVELGRPDDLPFTLKLDERLSRMDDVIFPGCMLIGCNMAIPREIVEKVGLLDGRFGAGAPFRAAEDTDYIYRVHRARFPVEYAPDLIVQHYHGRRDVKSIAELNRGYHFGNGGFYAKHITDWRLLRHFYWDFRKLVYELCGGEMFNESLNLSYKTTIAENIKGMCMFVLLKLHMLYKS